MIVTKIEELDKKRVKIYIDYEFSFVLYKGELRLFMIKENHEIENIKYKEITEELLPKRAKLRCMNLLKIKAYTEKQLHDKLKNGGYTEELITVAISYVKDYGYVNDRNYAEDFIRYNMEKKSAKRLEYDLLGKGISKNVISDVMYKLKEEGEGPEEIQLVMKELRKKKYDANMASVKEKQRLSAFLYRKGFTPETIRRALLLDITSI